jgi:hypothetical protein
MYFEIQKPNSSTISNVWLSSVFRIWYDRDRGISGIEKEEPLYKIHSILRAVCAYISQIQEQKLAGTAFSN